MNTHSLLLIQLTISIETNAYVVCHGKMQVAPLSIQIISSSSQNFFTSWIISYDSKQGRKLFFHCSLVYTPKATLFFGKSRRSPTVFSAPCPTGTEFMIRHFLPTYNDKATSLLGLNNLATFTTSLLLARKWHWLFRKLSLHWIRLSSSSYVPWSNYLQSCNGHWFPERKGGGGVQIKQSSVWPDHDIWCHKSWHV